MYTVVLCVGPTGLIQFCFCGVVVSDDAVFPFCGVKERRRRDLLPGLGLKSGESTKEPCTVGVAARFLLCISRHGEERVSGDERTTSSAQSGRGALSFARVSVCSKALSTVLSVGVVVGVGGCTETLLSGSAFFFFFFVVRVPSHCTLFMKDRIEVFAFRVFTLSTSFSTAIC